MRYYQDCHISRIVAFEIQINSSFCHWIIMGGSRFRGRDLALRHSFLVTMFEASYAFPSAYFKTTLPVSLFNSKTSHYLISWVSVLFIDISHFDILLRPFPCCLSCGDCHTVYLPVILTTRDVVQEPRQTTANAAVIVLFLTFSLGIIFIGKSDILLYVLEST